MIMIQKIFCGAFCFRCGLDRMELLMRSLCSLAISDSLRSCTLRLRNEFALLTTLFISAWVLASCSHDYAYAGTDSRIGRNAILAHVSSNESLDMYVVRCSKMRSLRSPSLDAASSGLKWSGLQTRVTANFCTSKLHQPQGATPPVEFGRAGAFNMIPTLTMMIRKVDE